MFFKRYFYFRDNSGHESHQGLVISTGLPSAKTGKGLYCISDPSETTKGEWLSTQHVYNLVTTSTAERKQFIQKQVFYEEGKHLCKSSKKAKSSRTQNSSQVIGALKTASGALVNSPG